MQNRVTDAVAERTGGVRCAGAQSGGGRAVWRTDPGALSPFRPNAQAKIKAELGEKQALCGDYEKSITEGEKVISSSVDFAREALRKAKLVTKQTQMTDTRSSMQVMKGYDKSGRALPGRETNLRKNPNGPAARRPGDMVKDLRASGKIP